jgi:hypothetical protein
MADGLKKNALLELLSQHHHRVTRLETGTSDVEIFSVDLSPWNLCFSDKAPVFYVNADTAARMDCAELSLTLQNMATKHGWQHEESLVLLDADGHELRQVASYLSQPRFAVIDSAAQQEALTAKSYSHALLAAVRDQIPLDRLAPYQFGGAVSGSRFFGRSKEVASLVHSDGNFAVTGIRRIGKSSLLREAQNRIKAHAGKSESLVNLDCSTLPGPDSFIQEVVRLLNIKELPHVERAGTYVFNFEDFLRRMCRACHGRIPVFLDEVDRLFQWGMEGSELLKALHAAVDLGYIRLIVAGLRLLEKEVEDNQSPFYKLFSRIPLGPFDDKEAEKMIVGPMLLLGMRFEGQSDLVARIHTETGGHPNLLQFFCYHLLRDRKVGKDGLITGDAVERVAAGDAFKAAFVNAFRDNVIPEDKVLVYSLLLSFPECKSVYTQDEMYGALRKQGSPRTPEDVDRCCDRLCAAGFFTRSGCNYRFAWPPLPRYMRANFSLKYLLAVARKGDHA